ncbi:MAG TPA: flagellar biosynthetic protein FliO [Methylibium sp.]|uniref:FliO/MopB family protein n=1 Tax=Methylibium sp. TaxID=2067992 RepID=UPI002DB59EA7|nr:flagellar biosynthetic protein FliO [Methylibium sp.]HEU4458605.1 flagellar biosynthetic protein FliO [Methylibium sp.]
MNSSLGAGLVWFLVVLAAIPVVLWMLKRTPYGAAMSGASRAGAASVRALSTLSLGPHQRIVTVEVGQGDDRRWLVLGVTPQAIHTLHTMAPQAEPAIAEPAGAQPAPMASFAALLAKARGTQRRDDR